MKTGDFDIFYHDTFQKSLSYLLARVSSLPAAEDILADSYTALWQSWSKIEHSNYRPYFYRILHNKLNDHLAAQYSFKFVNIDEQMSSIAEDQEGPSYKSQYRTLLMQKVAELNAKDKRYFELRYLKHKTHREIAQEMHLTIGNSKIINNRLVSKLKKLCQTTN